MLKTGKGFEKPHKAVSQYTFRKHVLKMAKSGRLEIRIQL